MRTFLIAVAASLLAACSAFGGGDKDDNVGMSFSEAGSLAPELAPGNGRIFVYRERSSLGNALSTDVSLNGEMIGNSEPGGFFYVDRPAADYKIVAAQAGSTSTDDAARKVAFTLAPGQSVYVKITIGGIAIAHVNADLVEPGHAVADMQTLRYGKPKFF